MLHDPSSSASAGPLLNREGEPYAYRNVPTLRTSAFESDPEHDEARAKYVKQSWHSQDAALRLRDRQIEKNVRMLCGQHYIAWSKLTNKFIDLAQVLAENEEDPSWQQKPVLNVMLYWYVLTHARMTENPVTMSFLPATGDRLDAQLAEVMDTIFKTKWSETGMLEVIDRLCAWLIPGGSAYLKSRIDPLKGEILEFRGPGMLGLLDSSGAPILGPDGNPIEREFADVAFDREGNPITQAIFEDDEVVYGEPDGQSPHVERRGALAIDVLSALEARGSWGPTPWHEKRVHIHRSFLTPEQVWDLYRIDVEPDIRGGDAAGPGELQRMLMQGGFFDSASNSTSIDFDGGTSADGFVSVYERWEAPAGYGPTQETPESPGGRLTIVCGDKVARDGVRPGRFRYGSPIRRFDFINLPGRPSGSSPQEMMNPVQEAFNRSSGQILSHAERSADPIPLIHDSTGIDVDTWNGAPGEPIAHSAIPGVNPVEFVGPPALGEDAWKSQGFLLDFLRYIGHIEGAEGRSPTRNSSGELVKELRFNSDRPIAATARRMAVELGRMVEDWMVLLPIVMDEEEIIAHAGEDFVTRTVTVMPYLFEQGHVNVIPDPESMLPEGRGERQDRAWRMWQEGAFGDPLSDGARQQFLEIARFPHLGRSGRPGGAARITAEQENGKLARGVPAAEIPVFEWYDDDLHIAVLEQFMASPDYLRLPQEIQTQFVIHRQEHMLARLLKLEQAMAQEQAIQATMNPPQPDAGPGGAPAGEKGGSQPAAREQPAAPRAAPPEEKVA